MDWNSLISAVIGGLIAVIPVLITLRNQAIEREKDREETRREARIQNRVKWIEKDILEMMDLVGKEIQVLEDLQSLPYQVALLRKTKEGNIITKEEFEIQIKPLFIKASNQISESLHIFTIMGVLVSSFEKDTDIYSAYLEFFEAKPEELKVLIDEEEKADDKELWNQFIEKAGRFQRALREKLISLRE